MTFAKKGPRCGSEKRSHSAYGKFVPHFQAAGEKIRMHSNRRELCYQQPDRPGGQTPGEKTIGSPSRIQEACERLIGWVPWTFRRGKCRASFLRKNGTVWTTDRERIISGCLQPRFPPEAEMTSAYKIRTSERCLAIRSMREAMHPPRGSNR